MKRWILMAVMFLLTITAKVQAGDFTYTTNVDNSITITGYVGSGGDVTIPNKIDGFPVTIIGNSAFYSCTNIISVVIGTNVASIGSRAFTGCHSLTNVIIPESVTSIGEEAFIWCDSLTSVAIPYSVACIESSAFASCTNLTAITVDESNSFYCSMDGVLFNESQSLLIQYPGGKVGSYTIPDNVTNIRDWSFVWCNGLTSVSIPSSVVAIGWAAFGQCVNLTGVYFEGHAPNLGSESVFFGATNSTIYYLPGTTNWTNPWGGRPTALWIPYNYLTNADNTITISGYTGSGGDVVIPDTIDGMPVTSIGDKSFLGIDSLISITIPGSVVDIGNMAFSYCWNLTNVVLGTNVVCIGSFVFSGNQIHGIFVPASATNIGENAFSGVWEITVDPINPSYSSKDGVLFDKNMTTLLQYSKVKEGDYTIPASVVNIGSQAFQDCGISIVTIPTSVTNIGDSAFRMSWLSSITIPRSVVGIGYGALFSCGHMSAITVDELNPVFSSIDGVLFNKTQTTLIQCPAGLEGIYALPASVTNIGVGAFWHGKLTSITIPANVTSVDNKAFLGDVSLEGVYFKGHAPLLGSRVFDYSGNATIYYLPGTTGWTNPWGGRPTVLLPYDYSNTNGAITITGHVGSNSVVTIPDEIEGLPVVSINNSAFQSSTNVTRITIPSSVTNLGSQVFDPCINLNGVYFRGNAPTVGTGVLGLHLLGSGNNGTVYYLPGTKGWEDTFLGLPTTLWRPQISGDSSFGVRTNKFGFNINWASGQMIVTEACTNVANSSWVPLQTNILASDTYYFSDLNWVNYPNRYYRVTTTQ